MLNRNDLLGKATLKRSIVDIGIGQVGIREMNGEEREEFLQLISGSEVSVEPGMQAKLVRYCAIDEDGDSIFTESDHEKINEMGGQTLEKIVLAIMDLSGITSDSSEELEKNSSGELSVVPGSDSPKQSVAQ
jgi:hypothetical protein